MDVVSVIGSIFAILFVLLIIGTFWTILWKFFLYKFPFIQAIVELEVSGDPKQTGETVLDGPVTPEQAQKEREARIAKRRTRKVE